MIGPAALDRHAALYHSPLDSRSRRCL